MLKTVEFILIFFYWYIYCLLGFNADSTCKIASHPQPHAAKSPPECLGTLCQEISEHAIDSQASTIDSSLVNEGAAKDKFLEGNSNDEIVDPADEISSDFLQSFSFEESGNYCVLNLN